jgi:hypothetical protein
VQSVGCLVAAIRNEFADTGLRYLTVDSIFESKNIGKACLQNS